MTNNYHLPTSAFWRSRNVLVTGHTGFKGWWITHLLSTLGATISGLSLDAEPTPARPGVDLSSKLKHEEFFNLSELDKFRNFVRLVNPDTVIHLAAHAIVQTGYSRPYETFSDNFLGTLNLLEILRIEKTGDKPLVLISTTDKVYKDSTDRTPHRESSEMWGSDPYSSSKVCVELLAETYRSNFVELSELFTARAGNVLGGGDRGEHRLIPYLIKQVQSNNSIELRMPSAIRPWQHVLDVTSAYLYMLENRLQLPKRSYNVAPNNLENVTVLELSKLLLKRFQVDNTVLGGNKFFGHETHELNISSEALERDCGFINKLNVKETIRLTEEWETSSLNGESASQITLRQISEYLHAK